MPVRFQSGGLRCLQATALLLALSSSVDAHLTIKGVDEVFSGALHPLATPAHVLIILGLALLLGQRRPLRLKRPIACLAILSALALGFTALGSVSGVGQAWLIGLALGIATLVVLECRLPDSVRMGMCAAAALGIGLDSGIAVGFTLPVAKTLLGTWIALNACVGYLAICASHGANREWSRIAIRVLASWILAISLLVLAFSFRK